MYLALYSGKLVKTKTDKGEKAQRAHFLDMEKCLDPHVDREDAVISVSEKLILTSDFGRKVELDLSTSNSSTQRKWFQYPCFSTQNAGCNGEWAITNITTAMPMLQFS